MSPFIKAGILEDGVVTVADSGTGQGSVISPLLGNIYLHYVFDLWAERWRRHEATGDMILVRYAALEMVAAHPVVVLEMADHGFDGGATAHLATDGLGDAADLAAVL